ncbi:zinc finger protein 729-like [Oppia nitens]|uniref:zinc finger protein 729-like n=1 Tax=Oppia nitens TaxID=1686743 RepID=UPI0023DAE064|nr:zinc finger protein 729-like [Oppia nitens]
MRRQLTAHVKLSHLQVYQCDYNECQYKTDNKYVFEKHKSRHRSGDQLFKCNFADCSVTMNTRQALRHHHQQSVHNLNTGDLPWLQCPHCPYRNKLENLLKRHMFVHTKPFNCDDCDQCFSNSLLLSAHMSKHTGMKKYRCKWPDCGKCFAKKESLDNHMETHSRLKEYRCEWSDCERTYTTKNSLQMHVERQHKGKGVYRCHWTGCDYQTTNTILYRYHQQKHDGSEPVYECQAIDCNYKTKMKDTFDIHIRIINIIRMSLIISDSLCDLSRYQLYSMVNALRREVQCLTTDLLRYQLFAEKYRQFLNELNENIGEIGIEFDEDLRQMRQQLIALSDDNDCEVAINEDIINHDMNSRYLDKECQTIRHDISSGDSHYQKTLLLVKNEYNLEVDCDNNNDIKNETNVNQRPLRGCNDKQKVITFTEMKRMRRKKNKSSTNKEFNQKKKKKMVKNSPEEVLVIDEDITKTTDELTNLEQQIDIQLVNRPEISRRRGRGRPPKIVLSSDNDNNDKDMNVVDTTKTKPTTTTKLQHKWTFVCDYNGCGKRFKTSHTLNYHKDQHMGVQPRYRCDWLDCGKSYATIESLVNHRRYHSGAGSSGDGVTIEKYRCNVCGKQISSMSNLRKHRVLHLNRTYRCRYEGCNKQFKSPVNVANHMKHHEKPVKCTEPGCTYRCLNNAKLRIHQYSHLPESAKPFVCQIQDCSKGFNSDQAMTEHQLRVHPAAMVDTEWIDCSNTDCTFRTKSTIAYTEHTNRHTGRYRCPICSRCLTQAHQYTVHMRTHNTDQKIRCEWPGCERMFTNDATMRDHMNVHTGAKSYRCSWPGCDKQYATRHKLSYHITFKHRGKGCYRCQWSGCGYRSKQKDLFDRHQRQHEISITGEDGGEKSTDA